MAARAQARTKSKTNTLAHRVKTGVLVATSTTLTREQKAVLAEALRRAEETRDVVEDALVGYGRWILVNVFGDDAKAALDDRRDNHLWLELLGRAGGPTLRLSRRFLYVAVTIAAHDKRIQDDSWRLLEPGRKELLLPIGEEPLLRKAAQHVIAMKLSQRATREYVRAVRTTQGKKVEVRKAAPRLSAHVRKFREAVMGPAFQRSVAKSIKTLDSDAKAEMRSELKEVREWATRLMGSLRD